MVYNGEVLNFRELRVELIAEGAHFDTDCDTEVLVALLMHWGLPGLRRVRGFFSFVLFDLDRRRLLAARDRYGIKPLYYRASTGGEPSHWFAFASEIKQFTAVPGAGPRVDAAALRDYLTWGLFDHSERTFFDDVRQLAPGHAATLDLDRPPEAALDIQRWCDDVTPMPVGLDDLACAEGLRAALDDAVGLSLRADVEPSVALSGGLDSSSVSALVARHAPTGGRPTRAFGAMFEDPGFSEARHATAVAQHCGLLFESTTVEAADMQRRFESALWHFDEPVLPPNMLAQHAVFELAARRGLRVMLTGQGGDELLCGYPSMYGAAWLDILRAEGPVAAFEELASWRQAGASLPDAARGLLTTWAPHAALRAAARGFTPHAHRWERRFAGMVDTLVARASLMSAPRLAGAGRLGNLSHGLMRCGNLRMLLHFEDRNSMAFGIETRPVMVDEPLERFCLGLPASMKLRRGSSKWLLRQAMRGALPDSVLQRADKLGFPLPDRLWQEGPFHAWLCGQALAAVDEFGHLFDDLIDLKYLAPRLRVGNSRGGPLWALASLGTWMQRFAVRAA